MKDIRVKLASINIYLDDINSKIATIESQHSHSQITETAYTELIEYHKGIRHGLEISLAILNENSNQKVLLERDRNVKIRDALGL